jgi:hypothetical protein
MLSGGRFTTNTFIHNAPTETGMCGSPYFVGVGQVAAIHMYGKPNGGLTPNFPWGGEPIPTIHAEADLNFQ